MSIQETAPLTSNQDVLAVPSDRSFISPEAVLEQLREQVYGSQDPFEAMAKLDPHSDWMSEAKNWAAIAQEELDKGSQLEVCFGSKFRHALVGSAAVALLGENDIMRHPEGLTRLYIPGSKISNIRARAYQETHNSLGGNKVVSQHRVVDMQITTSVDKPVTIFDLSRLQKGETSKVRTIPSKGSWFSFPLGEVSLALL